MMTKDNLVIQKVRVKQPQDTAHVGKEKPCDAKAQCYDTQATVNQDHDGMEFSSKVKIAACSTAIIYTLRA